MAGPAGLTHATSCRDHSKKPSAGSKHRRLVNASRKAGLFATVSERALNVLKPMLASVAQDGIRPQRDREKCRSGVDGSWRIIPTLRSCQETKRRRKCSCLPIVTSKSGRVKHMDKEQIVSKLREHEPELRSAGVVHLLVFGSVARGEASPDSDVDLMGEFDRSKRLTLLDLNSLELFLSEILRARVDLSDRTMLKGPIRMRAEREAVLAF